MAKRSKFAATSEFDKHVLQPGTHAHKGGSYFYSKSNFGGMYKYQDDLDDDATFTLPAIADSAWGFIIAGNDEEHAMFFIDDDGDVTLVSATSNVVANADTDTNVCVGTAAAQEPLVIRNRLGATKHINLLVFYN